MIGEKLDKDSLEQLIEVKANIVRWIIDNMEDESHDRSRIDMNGLIEARLEVIEKVMKAETKSETLKVYYNEFYSCDYDEYLRLLGYEEEIKERR